MSRRRVGARFACWWMAIVVVLVMGVCGVSQGMHLNLGSTLCLGPGSIYYEFFHDEFAGMSNWANGTWSWMGGTPNWKLTQSSRPNTHDAVLAITWQKESLFMNCADDPPILLMWPGSSTYAAECSLWLPAMAPGNPGYPLQKYKEAGIVVYQDEDNYYLLALSADGYFLVLRVVDGEATPLVGPDYSEHIRIGKAENNLRVECRGAALSMWINGELVAVTSDRGLQEAGNVALFADAVRRGEILVAAFDNFVLANP